MKGFARPTLPANLSEPCPPIPELDTESWDALNKAYIDLAFSYGECEMRRKAIVEVFG
ncbi:hypothetical protein [Alcaligenes sp. Lyrl_28]|uniref:hypothetical protein n=1 Tax=Alcaligenes sp. Lyrl_28 TaxID=3110924 RepID=UPI003F7C186B